MCQSLKGPKAWHHGWPVVSAAITLTAGATVASKVSGKAPATLLDLPNLLQRLFSSSATTIVGVALLIAVAVVLLRAWSHNRQVPCLVPNSPRKLHRMFLMPSKHKVTLGEKVTYALELFFSTHPLAKAGIFMACTIVMILVGAVAFVAVSPDDSQHGLAEEVWIAWSMLADSGAHASEESIRRRWVGVPLTMVGMLLIAILVGLVTDGISNHVEKIKRGGQVIESGHTLILGWTPYTTQLIVQLTFANASEGGQAIVILASEDKANMDAQIHATIKDSRKSKIVTRQGHIMCQQDLRKCSVASARSIIVLSPNSLEEADAMVVQTCAVLQSMPDVHASIVAEFVDTDNIDLLQTVSFRQPDARWPRMHTPNPIVPVAAHHWAGQLIVYRACCPGYAAVLRELLGFKGQEFYFQEWPELYGKVFEDIVFCFEDAVVCGIRMGDQTTINPPLSTVYQPGDQLLVIAEDNNSYMPSKGPSRKPKATTKAAAAFLARLDTRKQDKPPSRVLICNWRHEVEDIIAFLGHAVGPGSSVTIASTHPVEEREESLRTLRADLSALPFTNVLASPLSRKSLAELPLEVFDKVLVLSPDDAPQAADNNAVRHLCDKDFKVMSTALLIRHLQVQRGRSDSFILTELTGSGNVEEALTATWLDDFAFPNAVQAMVIANMAEDANVGNVLFELARDPVGSTSIKIVKAGTYADSRESVSFWDLQMRTLSQGQALIGWQRLHSAGEEDWVLNPPSKHIPVQWSPQDNLIVICQRQIQHRAHAHTPSSSGRFKRAEVF